MYQETAADIGKQCFSLGADGVSIAGSALTAYWFPDGVIQGDTCWSREIYLFLRHLAGTQPHVQLIQSRKRELQGELLKVSREMKNWISASVKFKGKEKRSWCEGEKGFARLKTE